MVEITPDNLWWQRRLLKTDLCVVSDLEVVKKVVFGLDT